MRCFLWLNSLRRSRLLLFQNPGFIMIGAFGQLQNRKGRHLLRRHKNQILRGTFLLFEGFLNTVSQVMSKQFVEGDVLICIVRILIVFYIFADTYDEARSNLDRAVYESGREEEPASSDIVTICSHQLGLLEDLASQSFDN